jgi:SAM-dependent methyltransferase
MSLIDRIAPGYRDSRRELALKRPRHFRLLGHVGAAPAVPFEDLPEREAGRINAHSRRYFERDDMRRFWTNKPFSDAPWTGWTLARFGQLLTALDLRPGDRVLDFGCGTGWSSEMLARMGMDVVAMDVSPAALEMARQSAAPRAREAAGVEPRFELYSGGRLDFPDGHFDAVLVFDAFHHLPNPQALLAEFCRVLAPNCRLGMAEPGIGHADNPHTKEEMETGVLEREIDIEQLHAAGLAAGFRGLEAVVPGLHPHALTLPIRRLRWYLRGLSWLLPSNLLRLAILGAPVVLLWKGPHFISSLHPRDQSAEIQPAVGSLSCSPGESVTFAVALRNTNATVWLRAGRHGRGYVRVGAHLLDASGGLLALDHARAALSADVPMHGRVQASLTLQAPAVPGRYIVRLDMVNEGIAWFEEGGSKAVDVGLEVTPKDSGVGIQESVAAPNPES